MKYFILLSLLVLSAFFVDKVLAVPARSAPLCEGRGIITSISDMKVSMKGAKYYLVNLDLEPENLNCEQVEGPIYKDGELIFVGDREIISEGDYISANIRFGGDEYLGGYFLSNVKVLSHTDKLQPPDKKKEILFTIFVVAMYLTIVTVGTGIVLYIFSIKNNNIRKRAKYILLSGFVTAIILYIIYIFSGWNFDINL